MAHAREINLIPCDVILREKSQGRILMWAGVILLIIPLLLGFYVIEQRKISAAEGIIADLSLKKMEIEKMIHQLNILQDKRDRLARKERVINTLLNKRSISLVFAELEKDMNKNVWLTSFDFKDDFSVMKRGGNGGDSEEWVETGYFIVKQDLPETQNNSQAEAPDITARLRGMAKSNRDLAQFLEQLTRSDIFSEVNLRYSREGRQGRPGGLHMVDFEIETYLKHIQHM